MNVLKIGLVLLLSGVAVITDAQTLPTLSNVYFTTTDGGAIDANGLQQKLPIRLNLTLFNFSPNEEVSAGSFEFRIETGNIATLLPGTDLKKLPYTYYIAWAYEKGEKGNTFLQGKIIKPLPANFVGKLQVDLQCIASGKSEIKTAIYSQGKILTSSISQAFFSVISK